MSVKLRETQYPQFIQINLESDTYKPKQLKEAWDRVKQFLISEIDIQYEENSEDLFTDLIKTFLFRFRHNNLVLYDEHKEKIQNYIELMIIPEDIPDKVPEYEVPKYKTEKAIKVFIDKKDLARTFIKIQPLFYDEGKNFWIWNFKRNTWEMRDEIHILNLISDSSHADTISSKEKHEILEALKQVGRMNSPEKMPKTWIQFKNVLVDIKTGRHYESTPKYFCTNPIPWEIGKETTTPKMDEIFKEWVGEKYVKTLKEIAAYCMLSDYPIHRIFCFLGSGRNGKSKYLHLIEKIIGEDNVTSVDLDTLMQSRFEMFNLYKKLAVQMGETNFTTMSRTATLKKLTGQDKVSFEAKNKDPIADVNYAKLLVSTNNLPDTEDKTDGFFRRWVCIDFPNEFSEGKEVLDRIPEEEYHNFCTAAIGILSDLLKKGSFHEEGTIAERQKRYEERSNPFDKFIKENCEEYEGEHIFKHDFKTSYIEWCKTNRFRPPTDMDISKKMKSHGFSEGKEKSDVYDSNKSEWKRYRAWRGVCWKKATITTEFVEEVEAANKINQINGLQEEVM